MSLLLSRVVMNIWWLSWRREGVFILRTLPIS
jgi:hypothetical protein